MSGTAWRRWARWLDWVLRGLLRRWRTPPTLGERGEAAAARYLRRRGLRIVARRARDRLGEIDLVAVQGRTIVFVEVKTRASGDPRQAVDDRKQQQVTRAALSYLKRHDLLEYPVRFDVVAVLWPPHRRRPQITHLPGAFESHRPFGQWF